MSTNYNKDLKETAERKAIPEGYKDNKHKVDIYAEVKSILGEEKAKELGLKIKWGKLKLLY